MRGPSCGTFKPASGGAAAGHRVSITLPNVEQSLFQKNNKNAYHFRVSIPFCLIRSAASANGAGTVLVLWQHLYFIIDAYVGFFSGIAPSPVGSL